MRAHICFRCNVEPAYGGYSPTSTTQRTRRRHLMRAVDRGVIANVVGNAWVALMALVFSPLYIRYIGIEAYGLIGVFAMLQVLISVFDLGAGRTITHEAIRYRSGRRSAQSVRDLQFTFAVAYFSIAIVVSVCLFLAAPWLSRHWLNLGDLPHADAVLALRLAAVVIGLRWLCGVHRSILIGTPAVVWVNANAAAFATVRGVSSVIVAVFVSSSVQAFFVLQLLLTGCELVVMAWRLRSALPVAPSGARFSVHSLRPIWRFSAGVTLITAVSVIGSQLDKIALSQFLPLRDFGYYALASALAGSARMFSYPASQAHLLFATFIEREQRDGLIAAFHRCSQLVALLLMPPCVVLCLFADRVMILWGLDSDAVAAFSPVVSLLVIGTLLNGLMTLPYALQLAQGRTRTFLWLNVGILVTYVPLLWIGVQVAGGPGAAAAWALVNLGYVVVGAPLLLNAIPSPERWRWVRQDVLVPLAVMVAVAGAIRDLAPELSSGGEFANAACILVLAGVTTLAGAAASTCAGRELITAAIGRFRLLTARR